MDWIKRITSEIKKICAGPEDFLKRSIQAGITVSYPQTFLDIYYYNYHKRRSIEEMQLEEV